MRRLIVISAISVFGATAGVALGNFAAGGSGSRGASEFADYSAFLAIGDDAPDAGEDKADFAARTGPSSYHCEGCDASLYNDMIDGQVAELLPLPAYHTQDAPLPPVEPPMVREGAVVAPAPATPRRAEAVRADTIRPVPIPALPPVDAAKRSDRLSAGEGTHIEAVPSIR